MYSLLHFIQKKSHKKRRSSFDRYRAICMLLRYGLLFLNSLEKSTRNKKGSVSRDAVAKQQVLMNLNVQKLSDYNMLQKRAFRDHGRKSGFKSTPSLKRTAKEARFTLQSHANGKKGADKSGSARTLQPPQPVAATVAVTEVITVESPIIAAKIKDLVRFGQDQGYLTYDDINDALPDDIVTPEVLDAI